MYSAMSKIVYPYLKNEDLVSKCMPKSLHSSSFWKWDSMKKYEKKQGSLLYRDANKANAHTHYSKCTMPIVTACSISAMSQQRNVAEPAALPNADHKHLLVSSSQSIPARALGLRFMSLMLHTSVACAMTTMPSPLSTSTAFTAWTFNGYMSDLGIIVQGTRR